MGQPKISILILTKNADKNIKESLEKVFSQDFSYGFEVIIVDSGSTDNTLKIVRQYPVKLYQIKPEEFSHSGTRNYIASLAHGNYLVFLVGDASPIDDRWLKCLVDPLMHDSKLAAVYGKQSPKTDTIPIHQFRLKWLYGDHKIEKDYFRSARDRKLFFSLRLIVQ